MAKKKENEKDSSEELKPQSSLSRVDFPVVGIGASAGGLEAFSNFFQSLPADTGMAFILIQHIEPSHVANMVGLIQKYTSMPVIEVKNETRVEPNHVYMIPQNQFTTISGKTLRLTGPTSSLVGHSIDPFFRSLANDLKDKSICIILSGTGTDGTLGARAVKAEAGLVLVQDPADARYDGMPRSVVEAGIADIVLPAHELGEKLNEYVQHYHGQPAAIRQQALETSAGALKQILAIIRMRTQRDFSGYKVSTINRRIERRMSLSKIQKVEDYLRFVQDDKDEAAALANDFLIQVTSFFRDPEAFAALKVYLKGILEKKLPEEGIRIWTAGCSTGEEAYTLAILVQESLEELNRSADFQVFATDLDTQGIDYARAGIYPESIAADVSKDYLKKYFEKKDATYHVKKNLREKVVFAIHDLISDAPFSRIDLASARNVLIYLDSTTQKKVIPILHYALNPGGILFLGTAETVGDYTHLFTMLDRKWKIYQAQKKETLRPPEIALNVPYDKALVPTPKTAKDVQQKTEAEKALLQAIPPALVVDNNLRVIYVHGETGKYLQLKEGAPSHNLNDLAREDIRIPLSSALYQALSQQQIVMRENLPLSVNGQTTQVKITVKPVKDNQQLRLVVIFEDHPKLKSKRTNKSSQAELDEHNKSLEQELQYTRENLKSTMEELETANEELRSTLEEYQSTNEELHSTNEELETSKEELQSVNEELSTINTEHEKKIEELSTVNDDMRNLLNSTNVATIFLDEEQIIKRFTPTATHILNLMDRDVGRPISHITSSLQAEGLIQNIEKVLNTLIPLEKEVRAQDGKWYALRIYPYRTTQNVIAGVVLSFIDISSQKKFQRELEESLDYTHNILDTMREAMLVLDDKFKVISANQAFYQTFKVTPEQTAGKVLYELGNGQWNIPQLKKLLEDILPKNTQFNNYEVEHDFPGMGRRKMLLNARKLKSDSPNTAKILLAIEDITDLRTKVTK